MLDQEYLTVLTDLGLSQKEAKVYLALVDLGEASVIKITNRTQLPRVSIYPLLDNLIAKGFVSKFIQSRSSHYRPLPPKQIASMLKRKEENFISVLPLLEARASQVKDASTVEIFQGEDGVSSFLEFLYSGVEKELWAYGNGNDIQAKNIALSLNARNLRITKGIHLHVLVNSLPKSYTIVEDYHKYTTVHTNPELNKFRLYFIFGKQYVGIQDMRAQPTCILIKNEELATYHHYVFAVFMENAKNIKDFKI